MLLVRYAAMLPHGATVWPFDSQIISFVNLGNFLTLSLVFLLQVPQVCFLWFCPPPFLFSRDNADRGSAGEPSSE